MSLEDWQEPTKELSLQEMDREMEKLRDLKTQYSEVKLISDTLYAEVKAQEGKIVEILQAAGKRKYVSDAGTASVVETLSVRVPKTLDEKRAFFNWLKNVKGTDVADAYMSVNSNSLNSLYKQLFEEYAERGEVLEIDGLQPPTAVTKLSFRK